MLRSRKIAVTGGLASGKSTVCRILKELGAFTVDADVIVHQLLSPTSDVGKQVIDLLGATIITENRIDRTKVANIVFKQPALLNALEKILHPEVQKCIDSEYEHLAQQFSLFVAEIPLLFETNLETRFDTVIAVTAPPFLARQRFAAKTGYEPIEYDRRNARLLSPQEKARQAHYHIRNDGNEATLKKQVENILKKLY